MHNSSLLEILRTFNHDEMKRFEDFVSSPYFNKKSYVIILFKHIKKYAPGFKSLRLHREKVWKILYPGKKYNYGIFKNLVFDLSKLAEKFLTTEVYYKDEFQMSYNFLNTLNERELVKLFKTKFDIIEKSINESYEKKNFPLENYFEIIWKMNLLKFIFSMEYDRHSGMKDELDRHSDYLISNLIIKLLRAHTNIITVCNDYDYDKNNNLINEFASKIVSKNLLDEVIESTKKKSFELYNTLKIYYEVYKSQTGNYTIQEYYELKKNLNTHIKHLPKEDKRFIYIHLMEFLDKFFHHDINQSREILDIVKLRIKDQVILNEDGFMSIASFVSYVQLACNLDDSDFIEDFTKKFLNYLPKEVKDNLEKFSFAHLYFTKKEFRKSLEQTLTINYDLLIMKYFLKDLQMMNCYELNDYDTFLSMFDSYKHFLNKNKSITEKWKVGQVLFGYFLNRLFKLKQKMNAYELEKLIDEIKHKNPQKKRWLLKKTEEMGNKEK